MVEVGQRVRFDPMAHIDGSGAEAYRGNDVEGTVVMVNHRHRWFSVEYGDPTERASFHFWDIGKLVTVIG